MLMQIAHVIDMINHLPDPDGWTVDQFDSPSVEESAGGASPPADSKYVDSRGDTPAIARDLCYSMRRPEMAREITSCWICSVPSKMS
jgi:hypothetical protein